MLSFGYSNFIAVQNCLTFSYNIKQKDKTNPSVFILCNVLMHKTSRRSSCYQHFGNQWWSVHLYLAQGFEMCHVQIINVQSLILRKSYFIICNGFTLLSNFLLYVLFNTDIQMHPIKLLSGTDLFVVFYKLLLTLLFNWSYANIDAPNRVYGWVLQKRFIMK